MAPPPGVLDDRKQRIYELIVRRFFATLADDAVMESTRIDLDVNDEPFFVRGQRVVDAGWMAYYPYTRQKDSEVPHVAKGDSCRLIDKRPPTRRKPNPPPRTGRGRSLVDGEAQPGHQSHAAQHQFRIS